MDHRRLSFVTCDPMRVTALFRAVISSRDMDPMPPAQPSAHQLSLLILSFVLGSCRIRKDFSGSAICPSLPPGMTCDAIRRKYVMQFIKRHNASGTIHSARRVDWRSDERSDLGGSTSDISVLNTRSQSRHFNLSNLVSSLLSSNSSLAFT